MNDPQGLTIPDGLHTFGFARVKSVRAGKYIEIGLEADGADRASGQVREICRQILANSITEGFRVGLEPRRPWQTTGLEVLGQDLYRLVETPQDHHHQIVHHLGLRGRGGD